VEYSSPDVNRRRRTTTQTTSWKAIDNMTQTTAGDAAHTLGGATMGAGTN